MREKAAGTQRQPRLASGPHAFGLSLKGVAAPLLFRCQTPEEVEAISSPFDCESSLYGHVPHFLPPPEAAALAEEEFVYFSETYRPRQVGAAGKQDAFYAEGALLFYEKFGKRLSEFTEEVLANYPIISDQPGKELSVFGLSGSGKSTVSEALQELYGDQIIVMDSDATRYHLFAKLVLDVEGAAGKQREHVRQHAMHNALSGALYLLSHHVAKTLKRRGYLVVRTSTMPTADADFIIYLTHPEGIEPRSITEADLPAAAKRLYAATQRRVAERDNYDWKHAQTITDFRKMAPVSVQVPERIHLSFLQSLRSSLVRLGDTCLQLNNRQLEDRAAQKRYYASYFLRLLAKAGVGPEVSAA